MACKILSCILPAGTGNVSFTGLGLKPVALMLVSSWLDSDNGNALSTHHAIGFADGTRNFCMAGSKAPNLGGATAKIAMNTKCLVCCDTSGADARVQASLQSFDNDGFTLNVSANDLTNFRFIAIGWNNVEARCDSFINPSGAPPISQDVTSAGFQPDLVIMVAGQNGETINNTRVTGAGCALGFGSMSTDGSQAAIAWSVTGGGGAQSFRRNTDCIMTTSGSAAEDDRAQFTTMLSNGFRINWVTAAALTPIMYLALRGTSGQLRATIAALAQPVAPGNASITGLAFQPNAAIVYGIGIVGSGGGAGTESKWGISAVNGVNEIAANGSYIFSGSAARSYTNAKAIRAFTAPSTNQAEADLSTFNADGITFNFTTADAVARIYLVLSMFSATSNALAGRRCARSILAARRNCSWVRGGV